MSLKKLLDISKLVQKGALDLWMWGGGGDIRKLI